MAKLLVPQLKEAAFSRVVWQASVDAGTALDDVLKPEFWANVAKRLTAGSRIEVVPADRAWFAELFILSVTPTSARVKLFRTYDLVGEVKSAETKAEAVANEDPYYIKFRGPKLNWCVLRSEDHAVVKDGMTKDEAAAEAENLKLAA